MELVFVSDSTLQRLVTANEPGPPPTGLSLLASESFSHDSIAGVVQEFAEHLMGLLQMI